MFKGPLDPNPRIRRVVGASGRIAVLDFCATALPGRPGYRVSRSESSVTDFLRQAQATHLFVMDTVWFLDNQGTPTRQGVAVNLVIIALGKSVLPRAQWGRCCPLPQGPPAEQVVHFQKAMHLVPRKVVLSPGFVASNPWLCQLIEAVTKLPKSSWTIAATGAAKTGSLTSLNDVRKWLMDVRRVAYIGCSRMGGKYVSAASSRGGE